MSMSANRIRDSRPSRRQLMVGVGAAAAGFGWPRVYAGAVCNARGRTIAVGAPAGLRVGLKTYPQTLALAEGEVVLTLDDGPLPGQTDRVLNALRAYGAPATFFLIGRNAASYPGLVQRMAAEGHTVAHHTMNHPWTLRQRSFETGVAEIEGGIRAVQAAQGLTSSTVATPFFRYPGFADTPQLNDWLSQRQISIFGADLWASDWRRMGPGEQLSLVMGRLRRERKGIILLHDVVAQTADMFPNFLKVLCDGGYRIVSLVPGGAQPDLTHARAGWSSFTERFAGAGIRAAARP